MSKLTVRLALIASALLASATPAFAQDARRVEVGASMASVIVNLPEGGANRSTIFGVPTAGLGVMNPAVYASLFVAPKVAIEPQLGMFSVWDSSSSHHAVVLFGHLNYFAGDEEKSSPFIFAGGGFINMTDESTIKAIDGGAGYRVRVGDRLTFRVDGRYIHYFEGNGNAVAFTLSIGGLFGK